MDADGNSILFGKTFSQKANMKKVMAYIWPQKDGDLRVVAVCSPGEFYASCHQTCFRVTLQAAIWN
jgi:hypothetical protein